MQSDYTDPDNCTRLQINLTSKSSWNVINIPVSSNPIFNVQRLKVPGKFSAASTQIPSNRSWKCGYSLTSYLDRWSLLLIFFFDKIPWIFLEFISPLGSLYFHWYFLKVPGSEPDSGHQILRIKGLNKLTNWRTTTCLLKTKMASPKRPPGGVSAGGSR